MEPLEFGDLPIDDLLLADSLRALVAHDRDFSRLRSLRIIF
jgi:hypothetical protein